ncbi:YicC family protein [Thiospirochaeta perfilievii]|uniref:YicC family protein n=1 Tax=Thiospirochaeta perfilievii TaxID=252967 RepID=A0A5C1QEY0_9SPIO|nr:YicC/YloC family endoribonuclease [Thiospirochaeta perfilievii]QEN05938.1 YicC family protein [Thiospirochaeta perfilievii]
MRSMTGYGTSEYSDENIRISVDLKAYNNKYLDISLNMPSWLGPLEGRVRDIVKNKRIFRGRIEFNIRIKELVENIKINIDETLVESVVSSLNSVIKKSSLKSEIQLSDILNFEGVIKTDKTRDLEGIWELLSPEIEAVLDQFIFEKEREGILLKEDIFSSLDLITLDLKNITKYIPLVEEKIKNNFREKFTEVLGNEIDENRILSELGVLLVKYDINEEIVRLKSHIENFKLSSREIPCGKKLDFICQEMNREINTIGSKSPIIEISKLVVNMKNSLEQIREQARNVE